MTSVQTRPIMAKKSKYLPSQIFVQKISPQAELPYKERENDVGFDLTLISRTENRAEDEVNEVNYFNTGIVVTPPEGYYFEMMARSSLHKHGYFLATGTSIIDPEYIGEIIVPLYKFKECNDIELPFRAVQLVLKQQNFARIRTTETIQPTSRGSGGFGSTGYFTPSFEQPPQQQQPPQQTSVPRTSRGTKKKSNMF